MYRRNWQIVVGVVKKSLKRYNQIKNDPSPSALEERFTSLLESSIDSSNFSSIKNNPDLAKILKKYSENSEATFKSKYQSEISYLKLENLLARNKHAREIADTITTPAWSGRESVEDSNLRMIIDTAPKRMPHQKRIFTPPVPMRDRIHNAKEGSLDYKLSKLGEDEEKKESENFKELYKERLLGPLMFNAMSPTSSVGLAGTMADVRINEQIDKSTGQFKDHPNMNGVRGKPLRKEHLANCTDTNYFMNQILQKQECLPPG